MKVFGYRSGGLTKGATAFAVLLLAAVMSAPTIGAANGTPAPLATSYGGRSYGLGVLTWFGDAYFADTGNLPASGGALFADFEEGGTDAASGVYWLSYARGFNNRAISEPASSDVTLLPGDLFEVGASFAYAESTAWCNGVSGRSEVFDLTIGGVSYFVTGVPNQVVYSIPGVFTLIANEQTDTSSGYTKSIEVNALHVWTSALEIVVSSASSSVTCSGGWPLGGSDPMGTRGSSGGLPVPMHVPPADFMTGGGFFEPPNSFPPHHVNFGFNAGPRPGNPTDVKGHVNVKDHDTGEHVNGYDVTDYFQFGDPQDVCRRFAGPAKLNNVDGYRFDAVACDYGEPGRYDRFQIEVRLQGAPDGSDPAWKANNERGSCPADKPMCGELDGGNIQLHRF